MTAGSAQTINTHSNKESRRKKRRNEKGKYYSFNIVCVEEGKLLCFLCTEDTEMNKTDKNIYLCAVSSGGRERIVC